MRVPATLACLLIVVSGCGGADSTSTTSSVGSPVGPTESCVVRLHGKGDTGAATVIDGEVAIVAPTGNGTGWGGAEWRYEDESALAAGLGLVRAAADDTGCRSIVLHGFSNGGAFTAAAVCSGDDLDGRLVGVVVDDPVADAATIGCDRPDVPLVVYWTGALESIAPPGTDCASIDWTCAGDSTRDIADVAAELGVEPTPSPFEEHEWYLDAPEPMIWLSAAG